MDLSPLTAIGPLDGRYSERVRELAPIFSEFGLIRHRALVEIRWLQCLAALDEIPEVPPLSAESNTFLDRLAADFSPADAARVKAIEARTRHDVKAVEYFLAECLAERAELAPLARFLHFACTSWDINNLAYGLMVKAARDDALLPALGALRDQLGRAAVELAAEPLLSRTHGQPASPTTFGKEFANFHQRLERCMRRLAEVEITGKFNGAVGNFNAHASAYPTLDWPRIGADFVASFGLVPNPYTTQVEPYDALAELLDALCGAHRVLLDFCRDMWGYVALGCFTQAAVAGEVGSSTMPHKVNPIDFENAEGNLGIADALASHLAAKLPVSRWQRDLSDSTALRALGTVFGHSLLAARAAADGFAKLRVDGERNRRELRAHWEVLAEAVQTVLRKHGDAAAYERLKDATRGRDFGEDDYRRLVESLPLPAADKARLLALTPEDYIGLAAALAAAVAD